MELVTPSLGLVFWSLITFSIVLFLLSKFAWKPILKAVKQREESIDKALRAAEHAKKEIAQLKDQHQQLIDQAKLERDKILKEAHEVSKNLIEEARTKASEEGNRLIQQAKEAILNEKNAALTEMKNQVASLSIDIAEKLIRQELSSDVKQKELVNHFVKDLQLT
jgi:F-type H+-transporting ATPase subunit b